MLSNRIPLIPYSSLSVYKSLQFVPSRPSSPLRALYTVAYLQVKYEYRRLLNKIRVFL